MKNKQETIPQWAAYEAPYSETVRICIERPVFSGSNAESMIEEDMSDYFEEN